MPTAHASFLQLLLLYIENPAIFLMVKCLHPGRMALRFCEELTRCGVNLRPMGNEGCQIILLLYPSDRRHWNAVHMASQKMALWGRAFTVDTKVASPVRHFLSLPPSFSVSFSISLIPASLGLHSLTMYSKQAFAGSIFYRILAKITQYLKTDDFFPDHPHRFQPRPLICPLN